MILPKGQPHGTSALGDTHYFAFAVNDTSGSDTDGSSPTYYVRQAGDATTAEPILTGTPILVVSTTVLYPDGCYEVSVAATTANGFSVGNTYFVFAGITADSQTPVGMIGSFKT